jgi:hypothetical protein
VSVPDSSLVLGSQPGRVVNRGRSWNFSLAFSSGQGANGD